MEPTITVRTFDELSAAALYEILRLRVDVFVVEQNCAYRELDDLDQTALHVCLFDEDGLAAYLRVLAPVKTGVAAIGRVGSVKRRRGYAAAVLEAGIRAARERFGAKQIRLEAQTYAVSLYEKQGFRTVSAPFLLDGIEHVEMLLDCGASGRNHNGNPHGGESSPA